MLFRSDCFVTDSPRTTRTEKTLTHVATFERNTNRKKNFEYWFTDESDKLNVIRVDTTNPLRKLMEAVLKNPIKVDAYYRTAIKENREYYVTRDCKFTL